MNTRMNHKEALEAAHEAYRLGAEPSWEDGVNAAVQAYLTARFDNGDEHLPTFMRGAEKIDLYSLLADFKVDA